MEKNFTINKINKWDFENGYFLTCGQERLGKLLNQIELYKKIINIPGDILEFGVYKGSSFMRLLYLRELYENTFSREIIGFDIFGKFPNNVKEESDKEFISDFENNGGFGISKDELQKHINNLNLSNYSLIEGDIMETLPKWVNNKKKKRYSLVHVDVDVYEPTKLILENIWDKIIKGGVLVLDDFNSVYGETKAVEEFFKSNRIKHNIFKDKFSKSSSYIIKD